MSDRAEALATRLSGLNADLIALLEGCSPVEWQAICATEQWPVCAVAHHVALSERVISSWIRRIAQGTAVTVTRAQIDAGNAATAGVNARCAQRETIDLLRRHAAIAMDTIRGLDDERLATGAVMGPAHGREMNARQVIRHVLLRHVEEHTASIRATLATGRRHD